MTAYTICHNDDDRRDPDHRRVTIEPVALPDGRFGILCDGEPVELAPPFSSLAYAEQGIRALWSDPLWDLREVGP
jgi:hypothetical protein